MVALASLALQSAKKLFQKGNLENKHTILTLSGADVCAQSVSIDPDFFFFRDISLHNESQGRNHGIDIGGVQM